MCVGFRYTVRDRVLSAVGFTMGSRNGIAPSSLLFSTVTLMVGSTLLICSRKICLCSSCWMTKVSSIYLNQSLGGGSNSEDCLFQVFCVQVSHYGTDWRPDSCAFYLFIELAL